MRALQITGGPGLPAASPEHKRFNTLTRQIEQARQALADWQAAIPRYRQAHVDRVLPLVTELLADRRAWVQALDELLGQTGWTRRETETLRALLCDTAADLLGQQDQPDPALKALFDRHAEVDYDTEQRDARLAMKDMVEAMTGVDLGDDEVDSDDALLQRMEAGLRELDDEATAREQARQARQAGRRQSAAARRREADAQGATQSVREVYRKLASALHPDREPDPVAREAKNALMQRVNQAYEARDLLTLLSLQLQIEQIDEGHLARADAGQLKHYNRVLAEQLAELKAEIDAVELQFCADIGLMPGQRLRPAQLGALLDDAVRQCRAEAAAQKRDLLRLRDRPATQRWLKQVRQQRAAVDLDPWF